MNTNPHVITFGLLITIISMFFVIIIFYKNFMDKGKTKSNTLKRKPVGQNKQEQETDNTGDKYHVGGITTEHFILLLMQNYSLEYLGYSYECLLNKKTQTNYNAFDLYDGLWKLFGVFDEILALDYVEKGYGTLYCGGVDVTYREERDEMSIRVGGMYMVGTFGEMRAFRNAPTMNYQVLDIIAASRKSSDYYGRIDG